MKRYRRVNTGERERDRTQELPEPDEGGSQRRAGVVLRGLSGSLSLGLVVLTLVVLGVQVVAISDNVEGPGVGPATGHLAGSVVAVTFQRMADRRGGLASVLGSLGVFVVTAAVLWWFWWA